MATDTLRKEVDYISPTRKRVMGIIFLALGLAIWGVFSRSVDGSAITTFGMTPGGVDNPLPDWQLPSLIWLNVLAVVCVVVGTFQLVRGFGKQTNMALGIVVGMFLFAFLIWAAADKSLNLAGLINSTVQRSVPITLAAFAAMLSERAGVVNLAVEGMMLAGALAGAVVGSLAGPWIGLIAAIAAGASLAYIHALLSVTYKTDQIISGTAILIFATGITSFLSARYLQKYQELNSPDIFRAWEIPLLSDIPFLGPILFDHTMFVYAMFLFLIVLHLALFYTRWGLRLRSVGEHPKAADTLGINVLGTRYMAVILSGMMSGFAGGYFTLGSVGRFDEMMTAGRGFIGIAAMIFGNWAPIGSFAAGLLFGFADSLATKIGILGIAIPSEFLLMAPYLATMIVLAGVVGKGDMPAADGQPYHKEGH